MGRQVEYNDGDVGVVNLHKRRFQIVPAVSHWAYIALFSLAPL